MEARATIKNEAKKILKQKWKDIVLVLLLITGITFVLSFIGSIVTDITLLPRIIKITEYITEITVGGGNISQAEMVEILAAMMQTLLFISLIAAAFGLVGSLIANIFVLPRTGFLLKTVEGGEATFGTFLNEKRYWESFKLALLMMIKIFLWSLLFVIPGIVKSFSYAMAPYIKYNNPEKGCNECIKESCRLMNGYKGSLFVLYLSFIGWYILVGIGASLIGQIPVVGGYLSQIIVFIADLFLTGYVLLSVTIFYKELTSPFLFDKYNKAAQPAAETETASNDPEKEEKKADIDPFDRPDDVKEDEVNTQSENSGNDGDNG